MAREGKRRPPRARGDAPRRRWPVSSCRGSSRAAFGLLLHQPVVPRRMRVVASPALALHSRRRALPFLRSGRVLMAGSAERSSLRVQQALVRRRVRIVAIEATPERDRLVQLVVLEALTELLVAAAAHVDGRRAREPANPSRGPRGRTRAPGAVRAQPAGRAPVRHARVARQAQRPRAASACACPRHRGHRGNRGTCHESTGRCAVPAANDP